MTGTTPLYKRLKPTAVPHVFEWTKPQTPAAKQRETRTRARAAKRKLSSVMEEDGKEELLFRPLEDMELGAEVLSTEHEDNGKSLVLHLLPGPSHSVLHRTLPSISGLLCIFCLN